MPTSIAPEVERWFLTRRGIKRETLDAFGVYTERNDIVFPYPRGLKKRRYSVDKDNRFGLEKEGRRFTWEDESGGPAGAGQVPYLPPEFEPSKVMYLLEGESDSMALWQNAPPEVRKKIVGISGTGSFEKSGAADLFAEAKTVFVLFDNDDPYKSKDAHDSTERAWRIVRAALGAKARRVVLPQGAEDVADFFQKYPGWPAFKVLLDAARAPKMPYPRLDLSQKVPPTDWIVEGLIAAPDITVLYGDGGVSKSLFQQALAIAIVQGQDEFLGMPLHKHGRVLYIDQENPKDIVLSRLKKLGISESDFDDLYYVWYGGVRLDEQPDLFYDAVAEFQPEIVFLDSFSRLQTAPENDAEVMNRIFNDAIYPVARGLGVPVMALHHANKSGGVRGSTAIRNAADLALKVEPVTLGDMTSLDTYRLAPDKPRRGQSKFLSYKVVGLDEYGEQTDDLDAEHRLVLRNLTEKEPY